MSPHDDSLRVRPLSGTLGAEIEGVDLSKPLEDAAWREIHAAFLEHSVIAFRNQTLSHQDQIGFAQRLGPLDVHPIAVGMEEHPEMLRVWKPAGESASFGTGWHTDNTFFEEPSLAGVLYGVTIPPYGGDTLFASMRRAFDALSPALQHFFEGLRAVHSASRAYDPATTGDAKYQGEAAINYRMSDAVYAETEHPLVRTHPETGRKGIFVNPMFTQRIVGLADHESEALLHLLYDHATRPDFTCRMRWEPGTLLVWDNRCTQHYALDDYQEFERLMFRVTVSGDRPV